ncbi:MAG: DUF362 domain-containing protein [Planctomycetes bacterium]|nr:DUF362 domain-containing protein [Planctomycetota bacterium]
MTTAPINRRQFLAATTAGCVIPATGFAWSAAAKRRDGPQPLGHARGIFPGRVVWVHDPEVVRWQGPGDGHWWEGSHIGQERVDAMMARAVCELAGEGTVAGAWGKLFRHFNASRRKGDVSYREGERVVIKPNWVGMIWREGYVDLQSYTFTARQDYMNTAPQIILALLGQLTSVGVPQSRITVCDTLACLVHEYFDLLHGAFPEVRYEDYAGKFGRIQASSSTVPLYWSCRPTGVAQDTLPTCFAEADYLVNVANFKAHMGSGVTLCAKNHYGSLIRWPVQEGYYDMHPACFAKQHGVYRALVDLLGHAHLGGKTVLNLIDGLFSGLHPRDPVPQRMRTPPFGGHWSCSLFASQDPVAIDSVALDFLQAEWSDFPRQVGVDDYLHEAALAYDPPSGTFYDPDHESATRRLASLGVHEHWNSPRDKQYSRNLGLAEGIELVAVTPG